MKLNLEDLLKAKTLDFNFTDVSGVNAQTVKEIRGKLGLTQSLFAKMLHVSKKTVEKWEEGANPLKGGDAVIVHLLSEDPYLANKLLRIDAINQDMPPRFKVFMPKPKDNAPTPIVFSFQPTLIEEAMPEDSFIPVKNPHFAARKNRMKEVAYA